MTYRFCNRLSDSTVLLRRGQSRGDHDHVLPRLWGHGGALGRQHFTQWPIGLCGLSLLGLGLSVD